MPIKDTGHGPTDQETGQQEGPPAEGGVPTQGPQKTGIGHRAEEKTDNIITASVSTAVDRSLRWPETIMAVFTVVIACVAVAQCNEMKSGGIDTHNLAKATQNLAVAASDQVTEDKLLATTAASQADAARHQATSMESLAETNKGQLKAALASANAARATADALVKQFSVQQRTFEQNYQPKLDIEAKASDRFTVTGTTIGYGITLTYRNVGNVAAYNVTSESRIAPYQDAAKTQATFCQAADADQAKRAGDALQRTGSDVFNQMEPTPGQPARTFAASIGLNVPIADYRYRYPSGEDPKYLVTTFVGCFSYKFRGSDAVHHRRIWFDVMELLSDGSKNFVGSDPHVVPPDHVVLSTNPIGGNDQD